MELTIKINLDNAAFAEYPASEIKRILLKACASMEGMSEPMKYGEMLSDINGNTVGQIDID